MDHSNAASIPSAAYTIPLGVTRGLDGETYHADRSAISSTRLKAALLSGQHFLAGYEQDGEPTDSLLFGRVLHKRLLEPDTFDSEFVAVAAADRRTKAGRAGAAETDEDGSRTKFRADWLPVIDAMVRNVRRHPAAAALIDAGECEVAFAWVDAATGIKLKAKADIWVPSAKIVADAKTARTVLREAFARQAASLAYYLSAAMYAEGIGQCTGEQHEWQFIAIEKEPPYSVAVYAASESFMRRGQADFRKALEAVARWRDAGVYPGVQPDGRAERIDLPNWF